MKIKRKRSRASIVILLCICAVGLLYSVIHKREVNPEIQKEIAKEVIRFHVIANSDAEIDQSVKLVVKDNVVAYMQGKLKDANTKEEAKRIMRKEIPAIKKIAQKTVKKEGYDYNCNVIYHTREFPVKVYGDLTFPSGKYEALDVVLGNAEGKNWWCVMFPTLCFIDGTYAVVPDKSKEKLKKVLTEKEYEAIASEDYVDIEYAFQVAEWLESLKKGVIKIVDTIW